MQKKNYIRYGLIAVLLTASFIAFRSNTVNEKPICSEQCPVKKNIKPAEDDMIWETLSRQLFSFASSTH